MKQKRQTIGLLIDYTDSQYQAGILQGVSDYAEKHDVNLLCFEGGIIDSTTNFDLERNIIYDLVSDRRIHGAIILSDSIGLLLDDEMLLRFTQRFAPLPVVSVNRPHRDLCSVTGDSSSGMDEMIRHLVTRHNYRQFAFIKGLEGSCEAEKRYKTFCSVISEYKIPKEFVHIFQGDFLAPSGRKAVCMLLDKLLVKPDVIVASNDEMAYGALTELTRRGISVPDDIAVTGFDDIVKSSIMNPPLSTVRQPLHKIGWTAMEVILDILAGKIVNPVIELKSNFIVRKSCGCNLAEGGIQSAYYRINDERSKKRLITDSLTVKSRDEAAGMITGLLQKIRYNLSWMNEDDLADKLMQYYSMSIKEQENRIFITFFKLFLDMIFQPEKDSVYLRQILVVLFSLHSREDGISAYLKSFSNEIIIALDSRTGQILKQQNFQTEKETWIINSILDELHLNLKTEQIMNVLYEKIIMLNISSTYLSLYETTESRKKTGAFLMLAFSNNKRFVLPEEGSRFQVVDIIPDFCFPEEERFTLIIESLNYMTQNFGFIIFDMKGYVSSIYGVLRRIISNVVHATHLLSQVEQQRNKLIETVSTLRSTVGAVINTLALTVEIRDPYTAGHQHKVSDLSRAIGRKLGLPAEKIEGLRMSGIVHDIGKIFVPAEILNKPGKLMDIEFNLIKYHPQAGYNILRQIDFPWPIADIVLQHHERCDGSGYPFGLRGDGICIEAKILSVADVVEAITCMRPYRAPLGIDAALDELTRYRGIRFDADAVDACIELFRKEGFKFKNRKTGSI